MSAGKSVFQQPNRPQHPGSMNVPPDPGFASNDKALFDWPSRRGNRRDALIGKAKAGDVLDLTAPEKKNT